MSNLRARRGKYYKKLSSGEETQISPAEYYSIINGTNDLEDQEEKYTYGSLQQETEEEEEEEV